MGVSKSRKAIKDRELRVIQLFHSKKSQVEIAEIVGITQGAVSKIIDRLLERYTSIEVDDFRKEQIAMFQELHATWYPKARQGDAKAAQILVDFDKTIARYIPGAEAPKKVDMELSVDEDTSKALDLIASIKARGVVEEPEEKNE